MPGKPSKQKAPDTASRFAPLGRCFVFGVFLLIACTCRFVFDTSPFVLILFLMLLLSVTSSISIVIHEGDGPAQQNHKESRREHRRHLKRKKEAANFAAQLEKKDFETRLRSFTNGNVDNVEEDPESQMEFWEREQEYSRTPSRPVELIRYLLQRISKLVGQG